MNENAELQDILIHRGTVKCPNCGHCIPKSREAHSYDSMIQRCTNPNRTGFKNYGGRGISICERWRGASGFENFVADMGSRPEGTSIDRINVNGNYEPSNCRWATPLEQEQNKRICRNSERRREYISLKRVRRVKPTTLRGRRRCAEIYCLLRLRRTAKAERIQLQAELDTLAPIITPTNFTPANQVSQ